MFTSKDYLLSLDQSRIQKSTDDLRTNFPWVKKAFPPLPFISLHLPNIILPCHILQDQLSSLSCQISEHL